MSSEALSPRGELSPFEQMRLAREIIQAEGEALADLASQLTTDFPKAVDYIYHCQGAVVVSGMGKAGLIGQKLSATFSSTGTRSHFLHPAEAMHGDLGRIHTSDVALILSQSGSTEEVVRILPSLRRWNIPIVAITAHEGSPVGRAAAVVLPLGKLREACPLGLAPSTSTTAMLALGDALALVASRRRGFRREDFAQFHPGGSLGRQLCDVDDEMRPLDECRVGSADWTIREVFTRLRSKGRRTGAIMLVDDQERLVGIFTDSDLARLLEQRRDDAFDQPIHGAMIARPITIQAGRPLAEAVAVMRQRRISELPVINDRGEPVGLLDITDLLDLVPEQRLN